MRKKRIPRLILLFLLIGVGVCLGIGLQSESFQSVVRQKVHISDDSFLDKASGILNGEPSEVQKLRQMEVPLSDEEHQEYYFQLLGDEEKRCYREMLEGIRDRKEQFYLTI